MRRDPFFVSAPLYPKQSVLCERGIAFEWRGQAHTLKRFFGDTPQEGRPHGRFIRQATAASVG